MAILALITENQSGGSGSVDDVIGVFRDDHVFSDYELEQFDFMTITGSVADVQKRLDRVRPRVETAFYYMGKYSFNDIPDEPEDPNATSITVWSTLVNPIRWYQLIDPDKYIFKVGDLTQEEKDFIASPEFDINSGQVDNYLSKFSKDLGRKPENTVEIKDLKGSQP